MVKFKTATVTKPNFLAILVILIVLNKINICSSLEVLVGKSNTLNLQSIRCIALDKNYGKFVHCDIKPVNRSLKYLSVHMVPFKPIDYYKLHFRVLKKAIGGYKPFGIDVSLDMCKFWSGKRNMVFDWFYSGVKPYLNMNLSCPITTDVILKDLPCNLVSLPSVFPDGIYLIHLIGSTRNVPIGDLQVVVDVKEKEQWRQSVVN